MYIYLNAPLIIERKELQHRKVFQFNTSCKGRKLDAIAYNSEKKFAFINVLII